MSENALVTTKILINFYDRNIAFTKIWHNSLTLYLLDFGKG